MAPESRPLPTKSGSVGEVFGVMARLGCFAFGGRLSPGQAVRLDVDSTDAYDEVLTNPIPIDDGYASVPAGPGWGTDIDDEVLKKYPPSELVPVESEPYLDFF